MKVSAANDSAESNKKMVKIPIVTQLSQHSNYPNVVKNMSCNITNWKKIRTNTTVQERAQKRKFHGVLT